MRIISISGTLNSGKTTIIKEICQRLSTAGKRSAVIANEDGEAVYDDAFTKDFNVPVEHLRGG